MRRKSRKLALLLSAVLLFGSLPVVSGTAETTTKNTTIANDFVPAFIATNTESSNFVKRLDEYETSKNTIGFQSQDGSHSVYVFPYDIRYVDSSGNLVLYDQRIVPSAKTNGSASYR